MFLVQYLPQTLELMKIHIWTIFAISSVCVKNCTKDVHKQVLSFVPSSTDELARVPTKTAMLFSAQFHSAEAMKQVCIERSILCLVLQFFPMGLIKYSDLTQTRMAKPLQPHKFDLSDRSPK